jgi:hypothetical protein
VDQKTSKEDRRTFMVDDWRYSKEKLKLREQALLILLSRYGVELDNTRKSKYANQSIYECAHDWVSQGNVNCNGITKYYEAYYAKSN